MKPLNQNKMEKEFVPYELAVKLKKLGFDEPCAMYWRPEMDGSMQMWYHQDERFDDAIGSQNSDNAEWVTCTAPLYQQTFRWFRENKLADGSVCRHGKADGSYSYRWDIVYEYGVYEERHFKQDYKTYEEAELACLEKLIGIVESKSE